MGGVLFINVYFALKGGERGGGYRPRSGLVTSSISQGGRGMLMTQGEKRYFMEREKN